jgi:hypothetical protein
MSAPRPCARRVVADDREVPWMFADEYVDQSMSPTQRDR